MKSLEKLQKAVEGLDFASISDYDFIIFNDVTDLHYNFPFNAKSLYKVECPSKKSISQIRNKIVNIHAKQLHSVIKYKDTINLIHLKEKQGWTIRGNWPMNEKVEAYKKGIHKSVKVEELKSL